MQIENQIIDSEQDKGVGEEAAQINLGRHQAQCSICSSENRQEIEGHFIDWMSPDVIAGKFSNLSRDSVYRHAHALDLFNKRRNNLTTALEKMIQRVDTTPVSGSTILSAIKVLAKMESEKLARKDADPKKLAVQTSAAEGESSASGGTLPEQLSDAKAATPDDSQKGEEGSQAPESNRVQ